MTRSIDEVDADLQTLKTQVPTLEGLTQSVAFQTWTVGSAIVRTMTSSFRQCLFIAPVPCRVLSVAFAFEYFSIDASDTSYWQAGLEIGPSATWPDLALRTTQNTGPNANGPIAARTAWTFDAAAWQPSDLAAGQILACTWSPVGSPAALRFPMLATLRVCEL